MGFVDGVTMSEWFRQWFAKWNQQPANHIICKMLVGAFDGLKTLHANGILHRDIKPNNLMIRDRTNDIVLVDFGFSCQANTRNRAISCSELAEKCTAYYCSPDRITYCIEGAGVCLESIQRNNDVFAMALSFFYVLSNGKALDGIITSASAEHNRRGGSWLHYYGNLMRKEKWDQQFTIYRGNQDNVAAAIDALLRKALLVGSHASDRPTANDLYLEACSICRMCGQ
jgi:serine/threonine protein kinase